MTPRDRHRHARQAETRLRCRPCRLPYVVAGVSRRRRWRCHYCRGLLELTQVVHRTHRRR